MHQDPRLKPIKTLSKLTKRQQGNVRQSAQQYTSKVLNRLAKQACGELKDRDGNPVEMSMAEIRASEVILRKTLPDLSLVQQVEDDPINHMSREEMADMLGNILASNPHLAQLSNIQQAVDSANTVAEVTPVHLDQEGQVADITPRHIDNEEAEED